jgi:hypothetical protein
MSYLILDPTCKRLMDQLREADRQRDHLRAQLADAAMHVELAEVDRNLPWGAEPEVKARLKAEREAAIQARIAKRVTRRAKEMERYGSYTRPGTWDADLDNYQHDQYDESLDDGYQIRLKRTRDMTWNAYVVLPEFHPATGRHYDFFGGYNSPAGLPLPPQELTYNAVEDGRGVFGFYLARTVTPRPGQLFSEEDYNSYNFYSLEKTGYSPLADNGSVYVDYAKMRSLCMELVDYFKGLAANLGHATICRSATKCAHHGFYVGVCEGCAADAAPPTPRAPIPPHPAPLAAAKPTVKKTWAAVAAGK